MHLTAITGFKKCPMSSYGMNEVCVSCLNHAIMELDNVKMAVRINGYGTHAITRFQFMKGINRKANSYSIIIINIMKNTKLREGLVETSEQVVESRGVYR